eukprot:5393771-Prymnesium_polylepis.1
MASAKYGKCGMHPAMRPTLTEEFNGLIWDTRCTAHPARTLGEACIAVDKKVLLHGDSLAALAGRRDGRRLQPREVEPRLWGFEFGDTARGRKFEYGGGSLSSMATLMRSSAQGAIATKW